MVSKNPFEELRSRRVPLETALFEKTNAHCERIFMISPEHRHTDATSCRRERLILDLKHFSGASGDKRISVLELSACDADLSLYDLVI